MIIFDNLNKIGNSEKENFYSTKILWNSINVEPGEETRKLLKPPKTFDPKILMKSKSACKLSTCKSVPVNLRRPSF